MSKKPAPKRLIIPHEFTQVNHVYPGAGLDTPVGGTIVSSLSPIILNSPDVNRALWTFVSSLPVEAVTRAGVRLVTHADRFEEVRPDAQYITNLTQRIARAKGVYVEPDLDQYGHRRDEALRQEAMRQLLTKVGSWAGTMTVGELAEKAHGGWFRALPRYIFHSVLDVLPLSPRPQDRANWTCAECGARQPEPPETGLCTQCNFPDRRERLDDLGSEFEHPDRRGVDPYEQDLRHIRRLLDQRDRRLTLALLKSGIAETNPTMAWFITCVERALEPADRLPGETLHQVLNRLTGRSYFTVGKWLGRLTRLIAELKSIKR